ncbi:hypothetical protein D0Y65_048862 [Glycine soja]|uniref:Uncharacterized protein n=1 Tax=Glycine soja TaxID=3848 RepID=A0A445FUH7_GLYSO|nr:hypothetical protein D0Y65_048862 [Glycine soja]
MLSCPNKAFVGMSVNPLSYDAVVILGDRCPAYLALNRFLNILQNVFLHDAFVTTLRKAEQFLWASSEMDSFRDMVKNLIEAQKWAEGIRGCVTKIELWLCHRDSNDKKVNLEFIDELLKFTPAPCNEPLYHKLKDYAEEARLLIQDIDTALSMSSNMSELELLYSKACGLPIYMKEIVVLNGLADFIPSLSPSGLWTAVASYGTPNGWAGEVEDFPTHIYVFLTRDRTHRVKVASHRPTSHPTGSPRVHPLPPPQATTTSTTVLK